jgi:hypothetical protein
LLTTALAPPLLVNIAGTGYTTGLETAAVPVRSCTLRFLSDSSSGMLHAHDLKLDGRRDPATGDRYYVHPTRLDQLGFKLPLNSNFGDGASGQDSASGNGQAPTGSGGNDAEL